MFYKRLFILGCVMFFLAQTIVAKSFAAIVVGAPINNSVVKFMQKNKNIEKDTTLFNVVVDNKDELIVVQWKGINYEDREVQLMDGDGKMIQKTVLFTGSTVAYFDIQTIYNGEYLVRLSDGNVWFSKKIQIKK